MPPHPPPVGALLEQQGAAAPDRIRRAWPGATKGGTRRYRRAVPGERV